MAHSWRRASKYNEANQRGVVLAAANTVESILRARLPEDVYSEIEQAWQNRRDVDKMYPEQRRDFLITAADNAGLLMEIPLSVFGGK